MSGCRVRQNICSTCRHQLPSQLAANAGIVERVIGAVQLTRSSQTDEIVMNTLQAKDRWSFSKSRDPPNPLDAKLDANLDANRDARRILTPEPSPRPNPLIRPHKRPALCLIPILSTYIYEMGCASIK